MDERQYLQNELNRLLLRRGDIDTIRGDLKREKAEVLSAADYIRDRIRQLPAQPQVPSAPPTASEVPAAESSKRKRK